MADANNQGEEDPLIQALPPATDYLTYLTLLEYQLTPARLPVLHQVLQDEKLTTNIGWDLLHLLLPLLPESQECLQDVARLGNPREVILRVSDELMKLTNESEDNDDDDDGESEAGDGSGGDGREGEEKVPLRVLKVNSLLSMLEVLHSRIQTKYPSRFVASSIQAALEAFTHFPSSATTVSFLDFLRSLSSTKRPVLPPRTKSDQLLVSTAASDGVSAPDPEADTDTDTQTSQPAEQVQVQKLLRFALIEALKTFVLHCTDQEPQGMQWALRLQELLDPAATPSALSQIQQFGNSEVLTERDMVIGKILALSRDFGMKSQDLLDVILTQGEDQPQLLDFEDLPAEIPLERHGCLLLLAARHAGSTLFNSPGQEEIAVPGYTDLLAVCSNFLGKEAPYDAALEEPVALVDSLLSLGLVTHHKLGKADQLQDEAQFKQLIISLIACARAPSLQRTSRLGQIPSAILHSHPDPTIRFNVVQSILQDKSERYAHEPVIRWIKEELAASAAGSSDSTDTPFTDPSTFSTLFDLIYGPLPRDLLNLRDSKPGGPASEAGSSVPVLLDFIQTQAPLHLAALNLYFFLIKSPTLREKLQLDSSEFNVSVRQGYLVPLNAVVATICDEDEEKGVAGSVREAMAGGGEEVIEMARGAAGVMRHVIGEIESAM